MVAGSTTGPLDAAADRSLAAHMVQHVLLLAVAAPLLALGCAVPALCGALRPHDRRRVLAGWSSAHRQFSRERWPVAVVIALSVHVVVMVGWHAPFAFDAAAGSSWIHLAEHASFVITAAAFWWLVSPHVGGDPTRRRCW